MYFKCVCDQLSPEFICQKYQVVLGNWNIYKFTSTVIKKEKIDFLISSDMLNSYHKVICILLVFGYFTCTKYLVIKDGTSP